MLKTSEAISFSLTLSHSLHSPPENLKLRDRIDLREPAAGRKNQRAIYTYTHRRIRYTHEHAPLLACPAACVMMCQRPTPNAANRPPFFAPRPRAQRVSRRRPRARKGGGEGGEGGGKVVSLGRQKKKKKKKLVKVAILVIPNIANKEKHAGPVVRFDFALFQRRTFHHSRSTELRACVHVHVHVHGAHVCTVRTYVH